MSEEPLCPSDNTAAIDQNGFWSSDGIHWDAHRIGWLISGVCAAVTVAISLVSVLMHCLNYHNRAEQRQILRILYMPPIYAVISFFSYRFFRSYTYYELVETAYESITISAFMLLLIQYVAATGAGHSIDNAIVRKDKQSLPMPFCCWRFRPTKAYFMYTVKWSVLQYVIVRPLLSIVGIICQKTGVLCESGPWSFRTAKAYIVVIDAVSISIALYGLVLFYELSKAELKGKKPLAKFLAIKLIVMLTFYQSLVFSILEGRVIHATEFWTEANIADGLSALAVCIEMVFFSAFMVWAYSWKEYVNPKLGRTNIGRPLWDSINYADFALEIFGSLMFYVNYLRGKSNARNPRETITDKQGKLQPKPNFGEAFGFDGSGSPSSPHHLNRRQMVGGGMMDQNGSQASLTRILDSRPSREAQDEAEDILLTPYGYGGKHPAARRSPERSWPGSPELGSQGPERTSGGSGDMIPGYAM